MSAPRKPSPPRRPVVRVHETVFAATLRGLQSFGDANGPHEGIVYWAGRTGTSAAPGSTVRVPMAFICYRTVGDLGYLSGIRGALLARMNNYSGPVVLERGRLFVTSVNGGGRRGHFRGTSVGHS